MTEHEFIEILKDEKRKFDNIPFMNLKKKKALRYSRRSKRKLRLFTRF